MSLQFTLLDPNGRPEQTVEQAAEQLRPAQTAISRRTSSLSRRAAGIWIIPDLYHAVARVLRAGKTTVDDETVTFGIREFHFDADTGFWLNGRNFKIKGVCLHHDASAFGAAVPLRAWERRLEILKSLGVNAIRTAHNPPAPEFLDLCDRMGFLVMDETFRLLDGC